MPNSGIWLQPGFADDAGLGSLKEVIGCDFQAVGWNRDTTGLVERDIIESGRAVLNREEIRISASGEQVWLRVSTVPLNDVAGERIGLLGIYENITADKRKEIALTETEERLRMAQAVAHGQLRLGPGQRKTVVVG